MHVGLGEMYVADPRFAARYEALRPGLARFLADAIRANTERAASGRRAGGERAAILDPPLWTVNGWAGGHRPSARSWACLTLV